MLRHQQSLRNYHKNSEEALKVLHGEGYIFVDDEFIWKILQYELNHFDIPTEIIHHNLSSHDIVAYIKNHFADDDLSLLTITLSESIIPDELNDGLNEELIKAEIKMKGEIWIIHPNDKDPFPSKPHAHNYQRNCKIHLGNGGLYRKKDLIGTTKKKDLITLREKIMEKNNLSLPPYEL